MEKAGILTLYYENYNFGGLLQAYALPKILNTKFKIDAEQIRYSLDVEEKCEDKSENKRLKLDSIAYKMGIYVFSKMKEKKIHARKRVFEEFMEEIPHSKEIYSHQSITNVIQLTDFFIKVVYHNLPNIENTVQLENSRINKWTFTSTIGV